MKVIAPINITDSNMSNSIAEPDASLGEVEWVDPLITAVYGTALDDVGILVYGGDGGVYGIEDAVTRLDVATGHVTTLTGAGSRFARDAILANDGNIYFTGNFGTVKKVDVLTQTVSDIAAVSDFYSKLVLARNGNIYGIGDASAGVLKINIGSQSASKFGTLNYTHTSPVLANDGNIYCPPAVGGKVLKISTQTDSASELAEVISSGFQAALGGDGNIYGAGLTDGFGEDGEIIKIDIESQTVSTFGNFNCGGTAGGFNSLIMANSGNVYAVGTASLFLKIDVSAQTVKMIPINKFGFPTFFNIAAGYGDALYCTGDTGDVMEINTSGDTHTFFGDYIESSNIVDGHDSNSYFADGDSFKQIRSPYKAGDSSVKLSTSKVYQSAIENKDDPEIGAAKTPPTWIEVGPTNRYAAFDYAINTKSILDTATAKYEFTPNSKCTTVSLYGLEDVTRVYVEVRENNASGAIIYPIGAQTGYRDTAIDEPFGDFISNDEQFLSDKVIFDDLPIYSTPYIKVTFESNVSEIKVGDIVIGNPRSLGVVNHQSSTSRTSYDTVKTDIFGNEKITSRPSAEYTSFELTVDAVYADYVERILKDSLNKPRVWIGEKAGGEKLFTFGYYERSPIVYSSPTKYDTNLKIRGLV